VEKGQVEKHIHERKRKREGQELSEASESKPQQKKSFHQRQVLSQQHGEGEASVFDQRFIHNIFGGAGGKIKSK
jgi:hypothetical protein